MFVLQRLEEEVLAIILEKYNGNEEMIVSGSYSDFPPYMIYSSRESIGKLNSLGYLASNLSTLANWEVVLSPDALLYFESKGLRKELFDELPSDARDLLEELIKFEAENKQIVDLLNNEISNVKNGERIREVIGTLKYNGLIKVQWADNIVHYAQLTTAGRTYFEREKNYMEQMERMNRPSVNIENLTNTGVFNMGNITDSSITINNSFEEIEKEIEQKGNEDKQELKEILEEVKDYIDNINATKNVSKNTGLFKRIGKHFNKHQWFYSEIIGILGQAILLCMGNQV